MLANKIMGATSAAPDLNYIEDVFSTYLYTGTGATQTITNGIDLAGEGGLVWYKRRDAAQNNYLLDTARGSDYSLNSNTTNGNAFDSTRLTSFNADGFTLGSTGSSNGGTYASWTFRKQPKFFDIVTFTAPASGSLTVNHNLGSAPGFITVKRIDLGASWITYHRSTGAGKYLSLNTTNAASTFAPIWANVTSTSFQVSVDAEVDANGTYVAYLFAHDAGGFGLSGNENVISCGSWEGNGSTQDISLGYEPQYILLKNVTLGYNWVVSDTMRGMNNTASNWVYANTAAAEETNTPSYLIPTATGFKVNTATPTYNASGSTYIYIAIRRGPMKVPTDGTKVFEPAIRTGTGANATITTSLSPVDLALFGNRSGNLGQSPLVYDRLRGARQLIYTGATSPEDVPTDSLIGFDVQTGYRLGADAGGYGPNYSGQTFVNWNFRRAPGFMDVVCYTGTGSAMTIAHNLAAVPELVIVKNRSLIERWNLYHKSFNALYGPPYNGIALNTTEAFIGRTMLAAIPTASNFQAAAGNIQQSGSNYVAYLFATCPGVSKVGSYTGTGTTQAINCGFTAGARFVLIKRTDSTGDWYVWDSARGIMSGNDPYMLINSAAAEVTSTDYIDPSSTGFEISSTAPAAINASGGSYIFLAVA